MRCWVPQSWEQGCLCHRLTAQPWSCHFTAQRCCPRHLRAVQPARGLSGNVEARGDYRGPWWLGELQPFAFRSESPPGASAGCLYGRGWEWGAGNFRGRPVDPREMPMHRRAGAVWTGAPHGGGGDGRVGRGLPGEGGAPGPCGRHCRWRGRGFLPKSHGSRVSMERAGVGAAKSLHELPALLPVHGSGTKGMHRARPALAPRLVPRLSWDM